MKLAFDPQLAHPGAAAGREAQSGEKQSEGLKQLCQDFEAIFIHSLFNNMMS